MVNRVVIGRGRDRKAFDVSKVDPEKVAEDVKNIVCRGSALPFVALNGAA